MHESQWRIRGRGGHFGDWPGSESFHREFASRALSSGRLALFEVRTNQEVLAGEYALRFGPRLHWIIGARANGVSSRIGYLGSLDHAWKDGVKLIDALPGYYDYKRRLGARVVGVKDILAVNNCNSSRRRLTLHRAAAEAVSFAYGRALWWHVAPWLSKRMPHLFAGNVHRQLWTPYIRSRFLATRERPDESFAQDARQSATRSSDSVGISEGDRE
ncbi:MAG: GNAT family N-acetyltransferase [Planctomycetes bacterium]|nr:GNAT family N-acetyltransferase [Planctomycetota bacterium]MBI3833266.1 GNAT family N-acetyltransferase [Planctomycetota bacterium]